MICVVVLLVLTFDVFDIRFVVVDIILVSSWVAVVLISWLFHAFDAFVDELLKERNLYLRIEIIGRYQMA